MMKVIRMCRCLNLTVKGIEKIEDFDNRIKNAFDYIIEQNYQKVAILHMVVFLEVYIKIF